MSVLAGREFRVFRANDTPSWRESVALQRSVYCDERHYEESEEDSDPDCFDVYDHNQSRRIIVTADDHTIATARVILEGEHDVPGMKLQPELSRSLTKSTFLESSSFCCKKQIKDELGLNNLEVSKHITLILIAASMAMAEEMNFSHVVMVVERALFRYYRSLGFPLYRVGKSVEYHGKRQVCFGRIFEEMLPGIIRVKGPEWNLATNNAPLRELLEEPNQNSFFDYRYAA